nr:MAG TPA: hypothetical protein [Caudoviricetes sp.]
MAPGRACNLSIRRKRSNVNKNQNNIGGWI